MPHNFRQQMRMAFSKQTCSTKVIQIFFFANLCRKLFSRIFSKISSSNLQFAKHINSYDIIRDAEMNVRVRDLDIPTIETIDGLNNKRIELSKNPVATCGMDLHVRDCLYHSKII